jgi:hypothetical protein
MRLPIAVTDDLRVSLGNAEVQITPSQGLSLAERLTRKSFRAMLQHEADRMPLPGAGAGRKGHRS